MLVYDAARLQHTEQQTAINRIALVGGINVLIRLT
jgi:uncharacterized protein YoaH (UPF0181 family)